MYTKKYTKDGVKYEEFYPSWYDNLRDGIGGSLVLFIIGVCSLVSFPFSNYKLEMFKTGVCLILISPFCLLFTPFIVIYYIFWPEYSRQGFKVLRECLFK